MLKYFTITIFLQAILHTTSAQNIYDSTKNLQQQSYQAISWDIDQGVSLASVNCMLKDVTGFLWIGTSYGLNRFDGSHFINYLPDKNKNGTISDSHILSLVEDSLHNIWMGTFKGLTRYNIKADTFSNFLPPIDSTVLDPYTVPFWATSKEVFCIEMHSRITAYNIHSFERRVVIAHFDNDFGNLLRSAYSVLDEHNNCIWMYAKNGVLQVSLTGKQTAYTFPSVRKVKFDGYSMFIDNMCFDKQRNIIWQNTSEGLMQFSLSNKKFYRINEFDKLVNEKPSNQGYYMPAGNIGLDRKGHVWIGTKPNGTLIYNPETHAINQPLITNLQGNVLHRPPLYFDRDGIIWIGAGREIFQLNPINPVAVHYAADSQGTSLLSNNHIATMINGPQGRIWIGTWDGISIFDPLTGSFEVLREKDLPGFHGKNIMPLAMDSSLHTTWLKAWAPDALYQMDISTRKCRLIKVNDTTADHRFDMDRMAAELARPYNNGFIFSMPRIGIFSVKKDSLLAQPLILFRQFIIRMIIVEDHLLFVRTYNDAQNYTYVENEGRWRLTPNTLDTIPWTNIYFNKDDNTFWVGTINEIIHYDKNFRLIRDYSDGFPGHDVISMLTDNYNNVWFINGSSTVSRLNIKTGKFLTLSEKDGMQKESFYWEQAHVKDIYGNLYFGCGNGFYEISPGKFRDNYPPALVYIQSISINQKVFQQPVSSNYVQQLSLNHTENNIAVQVGILDYYSSGTNLIRYKLDGSTNWQYGSNLATINFNGLQPGKYRLVIQASNAANDFNGPGKILSIYIQPAWWQTWWFFTIAVLTAGVALYGLIRWRLHQKFRLRLQQSEKEKQLAELKDKTSQLEMETLRSQMNPHFIFNCLSSINRFILKNKTEEASDYLTKFSRLIRLVLNNSKQSFISLEDELETLRLYLEMERLRFKNSFDYSFTYNNSVDIDNIFIPPLLLQPFAENAIWHGLMHRREKGFLNFDFSVEEKFLTCTITDNGVGREQAELLKSKSVEKQKSMGLKITSERLSLLNNNSNGQTAFTIEDLVDENGNAAGTRVHLKIYFKQMVEV